MKCLIAGIGASTGGLQAFEGFLRGMPTDTGIAFVFIPHLAPKHPSLLPELLARFTQMPVREAKDGVLLEGNHVYVAPPHTAFTVHECTLREASTRQAPIDAFLSSLAADQGKRAVGIVLSGGGSDGTIGLRAVREHGGMTIVQSPETAQTDDMPRHAINSGYADFILRVEEMPNRLLDYERYLQRVSERAPNGEASHLLAITKTLRERTGHDFTQYKPATMLRRIQRRMQVTRLSSVDEYLASLERGEEAQQLLRDLLIGVTQFFRDPDAYEAVARTVLPRLIGDQSDGWVRVWVAGCATGEEAYSIAMLLCEHFDRSQQQPRIQLFATDIDEEALRIARAGRYPKDIAEQISAERLKRFFTRESNGYTVNKQLRDMCVFSPHNLIRDPPFSRLDLVSCRNLLIYFDADLQAQVLPLFHYALRPGGFLFLGPSEDINGSPFKPIEKKHRIFQRLDGPARLPPRIASAIPSPSLRIDPTARGAMPREPDPARLVERLVLDAYAPATVLVNEAGDSLYFLGPTSRYLQHPAGAPTFNLLQMAPKEIRAMLRASIRKASSSRAVVTRENVEINDRIVDLVVRPVVEQNEGVAFFAVVFQERALSKPKAKKRAPDPDQLIAQHLESELQATKDHLQSTIADLAVSNEELTSANEELLSTNEELQSANEEIQTAQEELQSVNEELATVNVELRRKIDELDGVNNDLRNLFASMQIATLFLDRDLKIKRFTPAVKDLLHMRDSDVGRHINDFSLFGVDVAEDASTVLRTLRVWEKQVYVRERDCWFLLRVLPYRTQNDLIAGVLITLIDITDIQRGQEQAARLAAIVASSQDAIYSVTPEGIITSWNAGAERMYGFTAREAIGTNLDALIDGGDLAPFAERLLAGLRVEAFETTRVDKLGRRFPVLLMPSTIRDLQGNVVGISVIAQNTAAKKEAEEAARRTQQELTDFFENAPEGLHWMDAGGIVIWANAAELHMLGYDRDEYVGHHIADFHDDRALIKDILKRLANGEVVREQEARMRCKNGMLRHVAITASALFRDGKFVHTRCFTRDITEQKRAEAALRESEERHRRLAEELEQNDKRKNEFLAMLAHELRNPLAPIRHAVHLLSADADQARLERVRAIMGRQVDHMVRLVDDLLDVARLVRGQIDLRKERVLVASLVQRAVETVQPLVEKQRHTLDVVVPQTALFVEGDLVRLAQIVSNLLQNAARYTPEGGHIELSVETDGARMTLRVRDDGIGIPPEIAHRIFNLFEQGDRSLARTEGGLGIGLTIARRLAELHNGTLTLHSEGTGRGSEFALTLPLVTATTMSAITVAVPKQRPRRILVVDDNIDAAVMLAELLRGLGHDVRVAHDGEEAIRTAATFAAEVGFVDIGLPLKDGFEVARELRTKYTGQLLVAVTGYGQASDKKKTLEAGFDHHLTKPVSLDSLTALLAD